MSVDIVEVGVEGDGLIDQTDTQFVVICDVPGIPKDRINIQVKGDMICIEGKRKKKVIGPNDKYLQTERRNGPFKRALKVLCSISSFSVDASYVRYGEDCCEA